MYESLDCEVDERTARMDGDSGMGGGDGDDDELVNRS